MALNLHSHQWTKHRIHKLFTGQLSVKKRKNLFSQLDHCKTCGDYYSRHQRLESALCNVDGPITPFVLDRVEASLFDALDELEGQPNSIQKRLIWAFSVLLSSAAAAVFIFLWFFQAPSGHRVAIGDTSAIMPLEFAVRGAEVSKQSDIGIRVFKVSLTSSDVDETLGLSLDDVITFTYSNLEPSTQYLSLFGIQESKELLWYYPTYDGEQSIKIQTDVIDEPLGDGIDLSVNHKKGALQIVAVFSSVPLEQSYLEKQFKRDSNVDTVLNLAKRHYKCSLTVHRLDGFIIGKRP